MTKTCSKCRRSLPLDSFGKCSRNLDGKLERCKECYNEYMRQFYNRNPEKIKQRTAKYFQENRNTQNLRRKVHYLNNREAHMAASKRWAEQNVAIVRAIKASNRAKRNGATRYQVLAKDIQRLLSRPCFYCNKEMSRHIDHIVPLVRGGNHSVGNLIGACAKCNLTKNAKTIMEWRLYKIRISNEQGSRQHS